MVTLRVRVENVTPVADDLDAREAALPHAMVGTHMLLAIHGGRFVSLLDPPAHARAAAAACDNRHAWPVLVGDAIPRANVCPRVTHHPVRLPRDCAREPRGPL